MKQPLKKHRDTYRHAAHFYRDVGAATAFILEPLGILPDSFSGSFSPHRLPELRKFCKENPDFHIFSMMKTGVFLNYAASHAISYHLGEGDSNPRLVAKDLEGMRFLAGSASHPFFTED